MPVPYRPTAYEVAILTVQLVRSYDADHGRNTSRFRISPKTLRRISSRVNLRDAFLTAWIDELAALGWSAFAIGDNYAVVQQTAVESWTRLSFVRVRDVLREIKRGERTLLDRFIEEIDSDETDAADDE